MTKWQKFHNSLPKWVREILYWVYYRWAYEPVNLEDDLIMVEKNDTPTD